MLLRTGAHRTIEVPLQGPFPRRCCTSRSVLPDVRSQRLPGQAQQAVVSTAVTEVGPPIHHDGRRTASSVPHEWSPEHHERNQTFAERLRGKLILAPLTRWSLTLSLNIPCQIALACSCMHFQRRLCMQAKRAKYVQLPTRWSC